MKPETKRRLAIEWLALLCSVAVGVGVILWDKFPNQVEKYWKSGADPIWVRHVSSGELACYVPEPTASSKAKKPTLKELASTFLKAENLGNTEDAKVIANAIRQIYSPSQVSEDYSSVSKLSDTELIALFSQRKYPSSPAAFVSESAPTPPAPIKTDKITETPADVDAILKQFGVKK